MSETNEKSDVLTTAEVAAMLRLHPVTVRLGAAAGTLPGKRIGNRWRFSRSAVLAVLKGESKTAPDKSRPAGSNC